MRYVTNGQTLVVFASNEDRKYLPRDDEPWNFHGAREQFEAIGLEPVDNDRAGFMSDDDFLAEYTTIEDDGSYLVIGKVWRFCALRESAVDALRKRGRCEFYLAADFGDEGMLQPSMHSQAYNDVQRDRYENCLSA